MGQSRDAARQEIPPELRRDVRLLGELLGNVIADFGGASLLRDVEKLRGLAIRAREDGRFEREAEQLEAIDDPKISDSERAEAQRRLGEEIDTLWRTAQMRTAHVRPLDEVRSFMAVFDETLFRMVPEVLRALDTALGTRAPAFLRFG